MKKILSDAVYESITSNVTATAVNGKQYYYKNDSGGVLTVTYGGNVVTLNTGDLLILMYDGVNWTNLTPRAMSGGDGTFDSLAVAGNITQSAGATSLQATTIAGNLTVTGAFIGAILPIGFEYTQRAGRLSPSELGLGGVWQNVSSEYAGLFDRIEGGNALAFGSGVQSDRTQGHRMGNLAGTVGFLMTDGTADTPSGGTNAALSRIDTTTGDPVTDGTNGTPRTGIETNPINKTVRIWRRIS